MSSNWTGRQHLVVGAVLATIVALFATNSAWAAVTKAQTNVVDPSGGIVKNPLSGLDTKSTPPITITSTSTTQGTSTYTYGYAKYDATNPTTPRTTTQTSYVKSGFPLTGRSLTAIGQITGTPYVVTGGPVGSNVTLTFSDSNDVNHDGTVNAQDFQILTQAGDPTYLSTGSGGVIQAFNLQGVDPTKLLNSFIRDNVGLTPQLGTVAKQLDLNFNLTITASGPGFVGSSSPFTTTNPDGSFTLFNGSATFDKNGVLTTGGDFGTHITDSQTLVAGSNATVVQVPQFGGFTLTVQDGVEFDFSIDQSVSFGDGSTLPTSGLPDVPSGLESFGAAAQVTYFAPYTPAGFDITVAPEPTSFVLAALGGFGLAGFALRRRKTN